MFSDDNSGDATGIWSSLTQTFSKAGQHQLHADAFASATALRDSLADDLLKWQHMETRLRRASQEVPQYYRMEGQSIQIPCQWHWQVLKLFYLNTA